jgi:hypothetical protein
MPVRRTVVAVVSTAVIAGRRDLHVDDHQRPQRHHGVAQPHDRAGVDRLVAQGIADPDRLGVMGAS